MPQAHETRPDPRKRLEALFFRWILRPGVVAESGTFWGRLRRERHGVRRLVEAWVPAVKVAGELIVEDAGADLQQ